MICTWDKIMIQILLAKYVQLLMVAISSIGNLKEDSIPTLLE